MLLCRLAEQEEKQLPARFRWRKFSSCVLWWGGFSRVASPGRWSWDVETRRARSLTHEMHNDHVDSTARLTAGADRARESQVNTDS